MTKNNNNNNNPTYVKSKYILHKYYSTAGPRTLRKSIQKICRTVQKILDCLNKTSTVQGFCLLETNPYIKIRTVQGPAVIILYSCYSKLFPKKLFHHDLCQSSKVISTDFIFI